MAKKDNLLKSKTLYTVRNQHSITPNGVIYENDHVTIAPFDEFNSEMALFSGSNFKYRINDTPSPNRRHNRSEYVAASNGDDEVWTLDTIGNSTSVSNETKIVLKPNYNSLKDFAYYGSAVELIKATINDVIQNYPGGIYYYGENAPEIYVDGQLYYLVSNEFEIDCWTGGGNIASGTIKNPMRILAASFSNYTVAATGKDCILPIFKSESTCPETIIGTVDFGAGEFKVYMDGEGKKYLIVSPDKDGNPPPYGAIIVPKQEFVDEFWSNIDDFAQVLLNRNTTPLYKATFETPFFTEDGFYYQNKTYIWPTIGETLYFNAKGERVEENSDDIARIEEPTTPDITTGEFQGYLSSLLSLATFHDTYDSDNIWRLMTHEAIKNLDWTLSRKSGDIETDIDELDTNGIGAMLRIYGRQFDDLKRYADNIKNSNKISYDEKSNIPDYFLTDIIENDGWVPHHTTPFGDAKTDNVGSMISPLYRNGKTNADVNSIFQRRLALSSNYIQSLKGTRRGLEAILGMFGYVSVRDDSEQNWATAAGEYNIYEYVATVLPKEGEDKVHLTYDDGRYYKANFNNFYEIDGLSHELEGCPVAVVWIDDEQSDINDSYLIPWFDDHVSGLNNYFQSKGGWGKRTSKEVSIASLSANTTIYSDNEFSIYGETQPYMRFVKNLKELTSLISSGVYDDMICYVTDISDIKSKYEPRRPLGEEVQGQYQNINDNKLLTLSSGTTAQYGSINGTYTVEDDVLTFIPILGGEKGAIKMQINIKDKQYAIIENDGYSHYFILKNKILSTKCGYLKNTIYDCYGWRNIRNFEMSEKVTSDGKRVLYMESIMTNYKGNNPHIGYGSYDDGSEYLGQFKQIFRSEIRGGLLEPLNNDDDREIYEGALDFGFNLDEQVIDNNKCAFFKDYEYENNTLISKGSIDSNNSWNSEQYKSIRFFDTPEDAEITECADETQANGIINIKKIVINFGIGTGENQNLHLKKYIENVVLRYLEEMIPSTAIVEYRFNNESINNIQ
jgi:hypothetical protein